MSVTGAGLIASLVAHCAPARQETDGDQSVACEFAPAQNLGSLVNSTVFDGSPTVSADETELFFTSERGGARDLFVATRTDRDANWRAPENLGTPVDDPTANDFSLRLSADGRSLYFASNRAGGFGKADLYVARRASSNDPWSGATNLGPLVNTDAFEAFPTPSADGLTLYFNRSADFDSQDADIWMTTRASASGSWSAPARVTAINSNAAEFSPSISSDGNRLYFASARGGELGVWFSTRIDRGREWSAPVRLGTNVNVPGSMALAPFISADERSLYFMAAVPDSSIKGSCTPGTCFNRVDLFMARRNCSRLREAR